MSLVKTRQSDDVHVQVENRIEGWDMKPYPVLNRLSNLANIFLKVRFSRAVIDLMSLLKDLKSNCLHVSQQFKILLSRAQVKYVSNMSLRYDKSMAFRFWPYVFKNHNSVIFVPHIALFFHLHDNITEDARSLQASNLISVVVVKFSGEDCSINASYFATYRPF